MLVVGAVVCATNREPRVDAEREPTIQSRVNRTEESLVIQFLCVVFVVPVERESH
jgi:hypothetical protein